MPREGPSTNARSSKATLVRVVGGQPQSYPVDVNDMLSKGDMSQNRSLQEGDVLMIPAKNTPDNSLGTILSALALFRPF